MKRIVYNSCFGGFGLDEEVVKWVRANEATLREEYSINDVGELAEATIEGEHFHDESGPKSTSYIHDTCLHRDNELLADIVTDLTEYDGPVNSRYASLKVAEVPDGIEWTIDNYDGQETVREKSTTFN